MDESKKNEEKLDEYGLHNVIGYELTKYTKMNNCYLSGTYAANDAGVYKIEVSVKKNNKKDLDKIYICQPISLVEIIKDTENDKLYHKYQFYNSAERRIDEINIPVDEVGSESMISILKNAGLSIRNTNHFKNMIQEMDSAGDYVIMQNMLEYDTKTDYLKLKYSSSRLGFLKKDGEYDFNTFITKSDVIGKEPEIDGPLFKTKGTEEGFIKMLDKIGADYKDLTFFKLVLATALTSMVRPFSEIDNPVYIVADCSACGKGRQDKIIAAMFGDNTTTSRGILRSSNDSYAGSSAVKSRLGSFPAVIEELQDLITKCKTKEAAANELKDLFYAHTSETNGIRMNTDGSSRDNIRRFNNTLIANMEGNQLELIMDGGRNRYIVLTMNLPDGSTYLKSENWRQYTDLISENYGFTWKTFVEYLQKKYNEDKKYIKTKYDRYTEDVAKYTNESAGKIVNNIALLLLSYDLGYEAGVFPRSWGYIDKYSALDMLSKSNTIKSSLHEVHRKWSEGILRSENIPFLSEKLTKEDYKERMKNQKTEVIGRKFFEKDGELYVFMPRELFKAEMEKASKGITGYNYDEKKMTQDGILIYNSDRIIWKKSEITRSAVVNEKGQKDYESVLKIHVDLNDAEKEEAKAEMKMTKEEFKRQELLRKKAESMKNDIKAK